MKMKIIKTQNQDINKSKAPNKKKAVLSKEALYLCGERKKQKGGKKESKVHALYNSAPKWAELP